MEGRWQIGVVLDLIFFFPPLLKRVGGCINVSIGDRIMCHKKYGGWQWRVCLSYSSMVGKKCRAVIFLKLYTQHAPPGAGDGDGPHGILHIFQISFETVYP